MVALLRKLFFLSLVSWSAIAFADPPAGYYATAEGKAGTELREALHLIISGHTVVTYSSGTVPALNVLDEDPSDTNKVVLIYSGWTDWKTNYGPSTGWNREHQWPQSYGIPDTTGPALADLQNLRACDSTVNSSRGNKYFDWSDHFDPNYHNPSGIESPQCTSDTDSWQLPLFEQGNVARALLYMATRYTGDVSGESELVLTDSTSLIVSGSHYMGKLSTLLQWHSADPVNAAEQLRNDLVYSRYQGNRNPFIDHPEWVNLTFSPVHTNPPVLNIQRSSSAIVLSWLATNQSSHLEFSTNAGLGWLNVSNTPSLSNAEFRVALTNSAPSMWFRLRVPSE